MAVFAALQFVLDAQVEQQRQRQQGQRAQRAGDIQDDQPADAGAARGLGSGWGHGSLKGGEIEQDGGAACCCTNRVNAAPSIGRAYQ